MKYILSITTLFYSLMAMGQADQQVLTITYPEAINVALKENVNLRQQMNLLESRQASRLGAKFQYLPNVSATATYTRIDGQQFDQVQGILAFTESDRFNGSIDANLTLFNGFSRISNIRQANYNFQAQQGAVERARQQLVFDVSQQYLQILLTKELLKIAQDNLEVQQTTLNQIQGFVDAGTRAAPDLYTQQAQVDQVDVLRLRAENNYRNSKAALMQTLLLEPGVDLNAVEPSWNVEEVMSLDYNLSEMYDIALANRPDLKQNQYQVEANEAAVTNATSGYYPTLTAFFSYGSNYSSLVADTEVIPTNEFETIGYVNGDQGQPVTSATPNFTRITNEVDFDQQFLTDNLSTIYGLRLSIPLFDRFQTRTNRVVSKIQKDNSELAVDNLTRIIYLDIQRAYLDFQAAKENYLASSKQYEAAKKALEVQQERYDLGVGNLVELSQANNVFILGASSLAQAKFTLLFQKVILDYNLGVLNPENMLN